MPTYYITKLHIKVSEIKFQKKCFIINHQISNILRYLAVELISRTFLRNKMKFKTNAIQGVFFLGFNTESYCYIVMHYKNLKKIHYVREVVFDESTL